jgi:hypothetical protein
MSSLVLVYHNKGVSSIVALNLLLFKTCEYFMFCSISEKGKFFILLCEIKTVF